MSKRSVFGLVGLVVGIVLLVFGVRACVSSSEAREAAWQERIAREHCKYIQTHTHTTYAVSCHTMGKSTFCSPIPIVSSTEEWSCDSGKVER